MKFIFIALISIFSVASVHAATPADGSFLSAISTGSFCTMLFDPDIEFVDEDLDFNLKFAPDLRDHRTGLTFAETFGIDPRMQDEDKLGLSPQSEIPAAFETLNDTKNIAMNSNLHGLTFRDDPVHVGDEVFVRFLPGATPWSDITGIMTGSMMAVNPRSHRLEIYYLVTFNHEDRHNHVDHQRYFPLSAIDFEESLVAPRLKNQVH